MNERTRYVEELNHALVHAIGRPRSVLDVGCGRGQNAAVAKRKGAYVVGLENHGPSAAVARQRLDEVFELDIEADDAPASLAGRTFDLLVLGDVLEHTRHPLRVLERFLPTLDDGGHVIISLPNVAAWTVRLGLLAGSFDYQPRGILDETHLRFFTRKTALRLAEDAGLDVLWTGLNPMIVRAGVDVVRAFVGDGGDGGDVASAILSHPAYRAYLRFVRPIEEMAARVAPGLLAFQHVIVARKPPARRKLSVTVGMIATNAAHAIGGVIDDIRRSAPEAKVLVVDRSTDGTPAIAEARGARVIREVAPVDEGGAMARLLYAADTDVIVTMGCDAGASARRIGELVARVEAGADLVDASAGVRAYRTSMLRGIDVPAGGADPSGALRAAPARLGYRVEEAG